MLRAAQRPSSQQAAYEEEVWSRQNCQTDVHTGTYLRGKAQSFILFFYFCRSSSVLSLFCSSTPSSSFSLVPVAPLLLLPRCFPSTSFIFLLSLPYLLRQKFLHKKRLPHNHKLHSFPKQIKIFPWEEITL